MTTSTGSPAAIRTALRRAQTPRTALALDAAVSGANGAAYLVAAPLLDDLLGLPPAVLRPAGAFLVAFAAALALAAASRPVRPGPLRVGIAVNAGWVVASVAAAVLGWGSPTTVGTVWILLQAAAVAGFAGLQRAALRRASCARGAGSGAPRWRRTPPPFITRP